MEQFRENIRSGNPFIVSLSQRIGSEQAGS
jgi:hypothetical protein